MSNIYSKEWPDYKLLDSGDGKKLEKFGGVTLIRPEQSALKSPSLKFEEWLSIADAEFLEESSLNGRWKIIREIPEKWQIQLPEYSRVKLNLKLTPFKHIGVFPEQSVNWKRFNKTAGSRLLNLFGYTGASSLAAAENGWKVTHVDSIKSVIEWSKKNGEDSNIDNIRWICEDAQRFVKREIKRKNSYDTIILDPPTWGFNKQKRGWKIERDLPYLINDLQSILDGNGIIILNCYSIRINKKRLENILLNEGSYLNWQTKKLKNRDNFGKEIDCGFLSVGTKL